MTCPLKSGCRVPIALGLILLSGSVSLEALNAVSHRLINIAASGTGTPDGYSDIFDRYLRKSLGLLDGRATLLAGRGQSQIPELWLAEGAEREDDGLPLTGRFFNHFHDPLKPWSEAGLHAIRHNSSSVYWMQDQGSGENWTWKDARQFYLRALTAPDARAREEAAADMFRALGQIMHLVVDASVPEHTRDDAHPFGEISRRLLNRRQAGNYEYWVSDQHTPRDGEGTVDAEARFIARFLSTPISFDGSIMQMLPPAGEYVATVPIARLIDTDRYTSSAPDPNVTLSPAIGIAEFANANFFSEDTLHGRFPFPRRDLLVPSPRVAPRSSNVRAYLAKPAGQGQPTSVALAECASERAVGRWVVSVSPPYPCVDEAVWEETASHMLPRAVGYARGVLDYFFRGKLHVRQVIARSNGLFIDIQNDSDEPMQGAFEVYARYQKATPLEQRRRVGVLDGGNTISLAPGSWNRFPLQVSADAATPYHVLVFRGRLGLEDEAIAARIFVVPSIHIIQESYDADVTKTCSMQTFPSSPTSYDPVRETLTCFWRPINHRVEGSILTNFADGDATDSTEPSISRVEAFWTGSIPGPAPLTIDGVRYDSGVWARPEDDESGPDRFLITDPAERRDSRLMLTVFLRSGERVSAQLATFKWNTESSEKRAGVVFLANGSVAWILTSSRLWRVEPAVDGSLFSIVSVGGYPVPTPLRLTDKIADFPETWRDVLEVTSQGVGFERVTSLFERYPSKAAAVARMADIPLESRFPQPPELTWRAVVTRKPPQAEMLQFWNAFGGAPPSSQITMTADELTVP